MNIYDDFNKKQEIKDNKKEKARSDFHDALDKMAISKIDNNELTQIIKELDLFLNKIPPQGGIQ